MFQTFQSYFSKSIPPHEENNEEMIKCFPFKYGIEEKDAELILNCTAQALLNVKRFKERGNEFYNNGRYQDAANEYTKAMATFTFKRINASGLSDTSPVQDTDASLDTQDTIKLYSTLLSNRSVSMRKLGRYENAKKDAEQVIIMRPTWFKGYFRKAEALSELRQFEEAKNFFLQSLKLEPGYEERIRRYITFLNKELENKEMGLEIYQMVPGREICLKSLKTPIQNIIFQFSYEMQNLLYIIGDAKTRDCVLVDACWDIDGILEYSKKVNLNVVGAYYTHYHIDHVGGIPPAPYDKYYVRVDGLVKLSKKLPDIPIYIHEEDFDGLFNANPEIEKSRLTLVKDGEVFDMPSNEGKDTTNVKFKIIHTPGHSPGSMCILVNDKRLFTGDTLFNGIFGRCDFPDSDKRKMFESLNKLKNLDENILILPGHNYSGEWTTIKEQKNNGPLYEYDYETWAMKYTGSIE
jgi:glyoxylase-like metal-dependent hydrolase (beta-lactamase superfamily II)